MDAERYEKYASDTSGDEIRILHLPRMEFDAGDHEPWHHQVRWQAARHPLDFWPARSRIITPTTWVALDLFPHITARGLPMDGRFAPPSDCARPPIRTASCWALFLPQRRLRLPGALPGEDAVPTPENGLAINRAAVEADVQVLPPVLERDFDGPYLAQHFGVALRHTIEPEVNYRYVAGINNFNQHSALRCHRHLQQHQRIGIWGDAEAFPEAASSETMREKCVTAEQADQENRGLPRKFPANGFPGLSDRNILPIQPLATPLSLDVGIYLRRRWT